MPHRLKRHMQNEPRAPLSKFGLYGLITFLILLIAAGSWVAGQTAGHSAAKSANATIRTQLLLGCDRTNVQRGYLQLRAHEVRSPVADMAPALFGIVWCSQTYRPSHTGGAVFLPHRAERCFLKLERDGYFLHNPVTSEPSQLKRQCATPGR